MASSPLSTDSAGAIGSLTTGIQTEPLRRGRRAPKVKAGCITCKIRKVKCDEGRPECRQCIKTGRKCDGYLSAAKTRTEVPTQGTSSLPTLRNALDYLPVQSQEEAWFLYVYRHRIVQAIHSCSTGESVYASAALRLAYSDTVMRAATVALAMGFERYNATSECTAPATTLLTHYNSALRGMHQKLEPLARKTKLSAEGWSVLLCTMLQLAGVELFAGNVPGALLHLSHIMRILKQHDLDHLGVYQEKGTFDELCRQLYLNLRSFPIPGLFTYVTPVERALAKHVASDFPIEFLAERDAVMAWYDLLEDYTDLTQWLISSELPRSVVDDVAIERMLIRAQRWLDAVLDFSSRLRKHSNHYWPPEQGAIFSTNVRATMLQSKVLRCGSCESHYDQFHADMETIMGNAQALSGFRHRENGPWCRRSIAASVFYVAIKCRDPLLRREAADCLYTWNGWHGPWYGRAMASTIVRRIIEVEEKGLVLQSALDVSVHSRVRDLNIAVGKHHERRAVVRYRIGQLGSISPVREEQISW